MGSFTIHILHLQNKRLLYLQVALMRIKSDILSVFSMFNVRQVFYTHLTLESLCFIATETFIQVYFGLFILKLSDFFFL